MELSRAGDWIEWRVMACGSDTELRGTQRKQADWPQERTCAAQEAGRSEGSGGWAVGSLQLVKGEAVHR
jgi:hypothetical protein